MKLFCGKNPKALDIEDAEGNWDMVKFGEHVESCPICSCGAGKIAKYLAGKGGRKSKRKLSKKKAQDMARKSADARRSLFTWDSPCRFSFTSRYNYPM